MGSKTPFQLIAEIRNALAYDATRQQAHGAVDALRALEKFLTADQPPTKPCPFCGGTLFIPIPIDGGRYIANSCCKCRAHGPRAHSMGDAIEAWDKREVP